jgi:hypothetical protein
MDVEIEQPTDNHKRYDAIKNQLKTQIEFYFSDENLLNDKFLKKYMLGDNIIDISILLKFNKLRKLLAGFSEKHSIKAIKSALKHSKLLKVKNDKISRINKFDCDDIVINDINKRTVYAENIPPDTTHEVITELFSRYGVVKHVSIPKSEGKKKGFAFITFAEAKSVTDAIEGLRGFIPKEFLRGNNKYEIKTLSLMSKEDWVAKKEEYKKLKKELQMENKDMFASCLAQDNKTVSTLTPGTLVKLNNLPDSLLDKFAIKTWVSHVVEPAFVDLNKGKRECVLRFSFGLQAEIFCKKLEDSGFNSFRISGVKMSGNEEEDYFRKVTELKNKLKEKKGKIAN